MKNKILCASCNKHKGTGKWIGTGNMMSFVHGDYQIWCLHCMTEAQLKHAKERARDIPILEKKLKRQLKSCT